VMPMVTDAAVTGPVSRRARGIAGTAQTRWLAATTEQLLARHGVLTREAASAESLPGGFGAIYPILKALEENGRIRRGYFVAGLGATQFALPGALDLLRSLRDGLHDGDDAEVVVLSAADPANPYGATLKWPAVPGTDTGRGATRTVGATVIIVNGALAAFLARGNRLLLTWLPEAEPERSRAGRAVAHVLIERARQARPGDESPRGMLIEEIDGSVPSAHTIAPWLIEAGFVGGAMGFQATFKNRPLTTDGRRASAHNRTTESLAPARVDQPPEDRAEPAGGPDQPVSRVFVRRSES
jgi:ATP-dependent Lhr-like helicase